MPIIKTDLAVIGAGAGGLSVASGAAQLGVSVVLIESDLMGGDCLNYGCIPSKALLATAKTASLIRQAEALGLGQCNPEIDMAKVMASVQEVITTLAVHDSVERFEGLGVKVIKAKASFLSSNRIKAGDTEIVARHIVIATGSLPIVPPISGLDKVPFYTNETLFNLTQTPSHLVVIGGGPIGCEMAQAFTMLGVKVSLLDGNTLLPRDDPYLVEQLKACLIKQGIVLYEQVKVIEIQENTGEIEVTIEKEGKINRLFASHLLIATGRKPNLHDLNLVSAQINYDSKGIKVDKRLRTSNKRVYALGDVIGGYQFTHMAAYQASIILRNILFKWPASVNDKAVPWVTYTHPELAHVGYSAEEALRIDPCSKIVSWPFKENDRAQTERDTVGEIRIIVGKKGIILGVNILGPHAGELLPLWIDAIQHKRRLSHMMTTILPYPTLSEINKRVASAYYSPLLFSTFTRYLVKILHFWG